MNDYFQALAEGCAARLAGSGLYLYWQPPPSAVRCWGLARWNGSHPVVYVAPYLNEAQAYDVLLHELAHCRDLLPQWRMAGIASQPLTRADVTTNRSQYFAQSVERRAEKWSIKWDQWATNVTRSNNIYGKLQALANWR